MSLPKYQSSDTPFQLMQSAWASALDPVLANPTVNGRLIQNVVLASGTNTVNHRLGRKLQGYLVVLNSAATTFYDSQSTNQMADKTLIINASGACTVTLYVF